MLECCAVAALCTDGRGGGSHDLYPDASGGAGPSSAMLKYSGAVTLCTGGGADVGGGKGGAFQGM